MKIFAKFNTMSGAFIENGWSSYLKIVKRVQCLGKQNTLGEHPTNKL